MPAVNTPTSSIPELKQNRNRTLVGSTGLIEEEDEEEEVVDVRFADVDEDEDEEEGEEEEEDCNSCDCDRRLADAFKEGVVEGVDVTPPPPPIPPPDVLLVSSPMDGPLLGDDGCATCALGSSSQS